MTCPHCQSDMTKLPAAVTPDGVTFYLCERPVLYVDSQTMRRCGVSLGKVEVRQP